MEEHSLPRSMGGEVVIDLCRGCDGIWFDDKENLQLAPAGTLKLLRMIAETRRAERNLLQESLSCSRCNGALVKQFDRVKATRFTYFRCVEGHGRFITFFQFLREKNLVQQLTPKELQELRARVQVVNCSNCGAPVDVQSSMSCAHCDAPLSVINPQRLREVLGELHSRSEQKPLTKSPEELALDLALAKNRAEGFYEQLEASSGGRRGGRPWGTPGTGSLGADLLFAAIGGLLRGFLGG